jgi:hypothetical protein
MYVKRKLAAALHEALASFPAIMLTGPRQSGKTTFLKHEIGDSCDYVSFDDPLQRSLAREDPRGYVAAFQRSVIFDEIQYVPELLVYLKIAIDEHRSKRGRFILTGSQQFQLMSGVTESLAGRIAILELLPLSLSEHDHGASLESAVWVGGYPEPAIHPKMRETWLASYLGTYVERDIRQMRNIRDLHAYETFVGLCAARHGRAFDTAALARECGITLPTAKGWATVLDASYIIRLLQPYHRNFGKRLVKTPKLYFLDPALVCHLTRQPSAAAALAGAMGGALFEGLIIAETLKAHAQRGIRPAIFFWRTHDGFEVDLVLSAGGKLVPVEIKLTATPTLRHADPLRRFAAMAGDEAAPGLLVCRVPKETPLSGGHVALPWQEFPAWLERQLEPPAVPAPVRPQRPIAGRTILRARREGRS